MEGTSDLFIIVHYRYLNRTGKHPALRIDSDFVEFLEKEGDLPKSTSTSALSGAGVMRLFNKLATALGKSHSRWMRRTRYVLATHANGWMMTDIDEWMNQDWICLWHPLLGSWTLRKKSCNETEIMQLKKQYQKVRGLVVYQCSFSRSGCSELLG